MDIKNLTIKSLHQGYQSGEYSVTEIIQAYLDRIEKYNPQINAFITINSKKAIEDAKVIDNQSNKNLPLFGIPVALKDLYVTKNLKTTAGSKVLSDYLPQYDATVVNKLKKAGAIIIGKLNEDAWGHGGSGENTAFGTTKNPWNMEKIPGGSSSGAGASVAADMCLVGGGTDTGGSVRSPASMCGVVGLKPTYGRVSRYGIVAYASSHDTIGHTSKTVWDNARYLEVTAGIDPSDATTVDKSVPKYSDLLNKSFDLEKLKIGVPQEFFTDGIDTQVKVTVEKAISHLESMGAKIVEINLPHTQYGVSAYYLICSSETSSNLGRYDGIRYGNDRSNFSEETKRRIMLGTFALSTGYYDAYYKKAMKVRTLIKQDFEKAFEKADVLITPVTPTPAFDFGAKQDPLQMYMADVFTVTSSLAGIPALSVPCGFSQDNLPIGMQIMGPQFSEQLLYQVGHLYEQATEWHLQSPKL